MQNIFDFHGINVLPSADDHVLLPSREVEIAVFIHTGQITRMKPSSPQGFFRRLRLVPIALHDLSAAGNDLADNADGDILILIIHNANLPFGNTMADTGQAPSFFRYFLRAAFQAVSYTHLRAHE